MDKQQSQPLTTREIMTIITIPIVSFMWGEVLASTWPPTMQSRIRQPSSENAFKMLGMIAPNDLSNDSYSTLNSASKLTHFLTPKSIDIEPWPSYQVQAQKPHWHRNQMDSISLYHIFLTSMQEERSLCEHLYAQYIIPTKKLYVTHRIPTTVRMMRDCFNPSPKNAGPAVPVLKLRQRICTRQLGHRIILPTLGYSYWLKTK